MSASTEVSIIPFFASTVLTHSMERIRMKQTISRTGVRSIPEESDEGHGAGMEPCPMIITLHDIQIGRSSKGKYGLVLFLLIWGSFITLKVVSCLFLSCALF